MEIKSTKDYKQFKIVRGNRGVNRGHVRRLVLSINDMDLLEANPIIVNDKMEVIDGQHRLQAAIELKRPIYYVVATATNLDDVQLLNSTSKLWTMEDYLESYIAKGNEEYIKLKDFFTKHDISITTSLQLLMKGYLVHRKNMLYEDFRKGFFKIDNLDEAERIMGMVRDYKRYTDDKLIARDREFINAVIYMYTDHPVAHKDMIEMFRQSGKKVTRQVTKRDYLRQFEEIFNWHKQDAGSKRFF